MLSTHVFGFKTWVFLNGSFDVPLAGVRGPKMLRGPGPVLQQVSFGGVLGYCSGYALKQLGKATAFVVGIGFLGLQTAQHYGYIEVDWVKVRDDALKPLDTVRRISNRVMERTRGSQLTTLFCVYFSLMRFSLDRRW